MISTKIKTKLKIEISSEIVKLKRDNSHSQLHDSMEQYNAKQFFKWKVLVLWDLHVAPEAQGLVEVRGDVDAKSTR